MHIKNSEASKIGLVLGAIWVFIGFNYDNTGLIMLGSIMLSMGLFYRFKKEPVKISVDKNSSKKN